MYRIAYPTPQLTQVGCDVFDVLLRHEEGFRYLASHECLRNLANALEIPEKYFTAEKLQYTLTGDYFILIGKLSEHHAAWRPEHGRWRTRGQKILNHFHFWSNIYGLCTPQQSASLAGGEEAPCVT